MIRKEHLKTATNSQSKAKHSFSKKLIFGQALETDWPVEEEYFFEAEDY